MDDQEEELTTTEENIENLEKQDPFYKTKTGIGLLLVIVSVIVALFAMSLPSSHQQPNQAQLSLPSECPNDGYTGRFCNEPLCVPKCHNGTCIQPNICNCNDGWTGYRCSDAICEQPCTSHGKCTAPNMCTCDSGWHGQKCEIPYAPGFQSKMTYVYTLTLSYKMESDIVINTDERQKLKGSEVWNFLSNVNITFSISSLARELNISYCLLKILKAECFSDNKNETESTFENLTCNENATKPLLQLKALFSQNLTTGKIIHLYYNNNTEKETIVIARILRFLDCQVSDRKETETYFQQGKQITISRVPSKSRQGNQCYHLFRTVKADINAIDREDRKICLAKSGSPELITMAEVYNIGKDMNLDTSSVDEDDMNLSPLPSYKGSVTALGSLVSMTQMTRSFADKEIDNVQNILAAEDTIYSDIDELAFRTKPLHEESKDSNFYEEINNIFNHPLPHRRLLLGVELIKNSKSAYSAIKEMIFTRYNDIDLDSRSLLIAMLGGSDVGSVQNLLLDILDVEETVKGDHFLALGAIAHLPNVSEGILHVLRKTIQKTKDNDVKIRSILLLGVLGSKGLQHKSISVLNDALFSNDVPQGEKCALISALGNTHSERAFEPLEKIIAENETFYRILSIRALKNIPGQLSYKLILERLMKSRNKDEALQCLKTLAYKGKWITRNDIDKILHIAQMSNDHDVRYATNQMLVNLQELYLRKRDLKELDVLKLKTNVNEIKKESQNFGVYLTLETYDNFQVPKFEIHAESHIDVKIYGSRIRLLTAGSFNSLSNGNLMSTAFMTLNLFGKDFDLFMKTWNLGLGTDISKGNPCKANSGSIQYTPSEHFQFARFSFIYGIPYVADVDLTVILSSSISFGYGLNIIGNRNTMLPEQVNVVAQPQLRATASFSVNVDAFVVEAGIQGDLDVIVGTAEAHAAVNMPHQSFCHFLGVSIEMLRGTIYFRGKVGVWYFSKEIKKKLFSWGGYKKSSTLSESYCCSSAFLTKSKDSMLPFTSRVEKKIFNAFSLLNTTSLCYQSRNSENCPTDLIDHLLENGVTTFNFTMSRTLNQEHELLSKRRILPILTTGSGEWFGLNEKGDVVQINELGQYLTLLKSPADILADLAYEHKNTDMIRWRNKIEYLNFPKQFQMDLWLTTKILNLQPYCSQMPTVCKNIKFGQIYFQNVMVFTDNPSIVKLNHREACSAYIREQGIRYPYYCDAYPFSFTLQGGRGVSVMKAGVKERNIKMEAIKDFIADSGISDGESFAVLI